MNIMVIVIVDSFFGHNKANIALCGCLDTSFEIKQATDK
jgi:hypothetical protein